ncbi:MAG: Ig-like domain-containing protein [Gemmatimonadota bacterium]|nr:Ig-like domain-containing protein [Gemmatimonadota bacterium]
MRLRLTALVAAGTIGCASASPPPGGPEDVAPPKLVRLTPDTNSVNVQDRNASFYFDETINDRGSGAQEVRNFFLVSPSAGEPEVSWHRSRIDVRPRDGFRPNTAYSITLLPGLSDLRNNVMRRGASLIFSTGPTIPPERITGTAFDWSAERPLARAFVQAVTPDSNIYLAQSDSAGRFTLGPLPPGSYLVRAFNDQNNNRALDRNEPFDTARVVVPQRDSLKLLTVQRDTLPPRIVTVVPGDSATLRVTFDRFLDPLHLPAADAFRLAAADSVRIPVTAVLTPRDEQKETEARLQTTADSARRVDSLAGKVLPPRRLIAPAAKPGVATPSIPAPFTLLLLRTAKPLGPGTAYMLRVENARALSGRSTTSERSFITAKAPPPPKPDSTRAPAATPPAARPPRP